jgi:hypothetical protein
MAANWTEKDRLSSLDAMLPITKRAQQCTRDLARWLKTYPKEAITMYYTVIDENCNTCGHKHRLPGRAVDCFDRIVDNMLVCKHNKLTTHNHHTCPKGCTEPKIIMDCEPKIIEIKKPIPLKEAGFLWATWEKYGREGEKLQEFVDKWLRD